METKPPTRTFPKLVMKEWPERTPEFMGIPIVASAGIPQGCILAVAKEHVSREWDKALSDFTRVVEEMGILDQGRSQKEKSR